MKKICFFVRNFSFGSGVERVTSVVANGLVEQGHEITILSLWGGHTPKFRVDERIKLRELFSNRVKREGQVPLIAKQAARLPQAVVQAYRFFKHNPHDIIIDTDYWQGFIALPSARRFGIPLVHWEHIHFNIDPPGSYKRRARKLLAKHVDGIVTLTERDLQSWQTGATIKGRIFSIPNPLPFPLPESGYDMQSRKVLAVGRLSKQKGFDLLLRAWAKLQHDDISVIGNGWQLEIVGDGEEKADLEKLVAELGIKNNVTLTPATPDIASHYRKASLLAMSSRFEGFGMVLLEAQAFSLPVVAFNCEVGPDEIIQNGKNGILVPPEDIDAFARALTTLMADQALRARYSEAARSAMSRFDATVITSQWLDCFNAVM